MTEPRHGIAAAVAAFFLWGVLPVFWKALAFLPPASIIAHRTLWSLLLLLPLLAARGELAAAARALLAPRILAWHLLAGGLLACNWLLYVWATLNDRILEGALGYYLNPFLNMLFGRLFFGERHSRLQALAIAVAAAGVALQFPAVAGVPWVAFTLALTFALYAVVRKLSPLGTLAGLAAETGLLAPLAAAWLWWNFPSLPDAFGGSPPHAALALATGLATAAPLLCFGHAARTIRLTTLGILQFLGPTLQFAIGAALYQEPLPPLRLLSFALVWLAVGLYAAGSRRKRQL